MSKFVMLAKYISTPIALRYDTSKSRDSSFSFLGQNKPLLTSTNQITIGVLNECFFSI